MKRIIMPKEVNDTQIYLEEVTESCAVFAKKDGKLVGMIVKDEGVGWIVRTGGDFGATGWHKTRQECIESCLMHGYTFYIED